MCCYLQKSTDELAIKDLADEVVAAVRAEGKHRFDLVGGSLGAAVATRVAAEYPEMGPFACTHIRFQPWKRSADELAVQTVASLGEYRQSSIHKTAAGEWPKSRVLVCI